MLAHGAAEDETRLLMVVDSDSPSSGRFAGRSGRALQMGRVALLITGAAALAVATANAGAQWHGGLGSPLVNLWQSGGLNALSPAVLKHLWKVERILVKSGLCPAATPEVEKFRAMSWPREDAGVAPTIAKIVYINLAWDRPRMDYMEAQLTQLSAQAWEKQRSRLAWERFEATTSEVLEHDKQYAFWRKKGFSQAKSPDVRGDWATAACAFSHYSAISQIPEMPGSDLVVIAEDDVEFSPDLLQAWEELWPFVPPEWDVLRIGWFSDHQNCSQVINDKVDVAGWEDPRNGECAYCGAQAYIVNPLSKERVLRRFELSRITHADELLGAPTPQLEDPAVVPPIRAYVIWPMLAKIHFEKGAPRFGSDRVEGRDVMIRK